MGDLLKDPFLLYTRLHYWEIADIALKFLLSLHHLQETKFPQVRWMVGSVFTKWPPIVCFNYSSGTFKGILFAHERKAQMRGIWDFTI